jgi:hypothetical protein
MNKNFLVRNICVTLDIKYNNYGERKKEINDFKKRT